MKKILSVSFGSSTRDGESVFCFGDEKIFIRRIGTDGDKRKARKLFLDNDGKYNAFGLGGTDLSIRVGNKRYFFKESLELIKGLKTPVFDGSGLKNSLERRLIDTLVANGIFDGKKVLLTCATDRFGMAEALLEHGIPTVFGDLIFGVGINIPLYSLSALAKWIDFLAPIYTRLPVSILYPIGKKQIQRTIRGEQYFLSNDIIAGDFHYIYRHMPNVLKGKMLITNTVTASDREFLRSAGVKELITTTPNIQGRSYGTNVLEAALAAVSGEIKELEKTVYLQLLDKFKICPVVEQLQEG